MRKRLQGEVDWVNVEIAIGRERRGEVKSLLSKEIFENTTIKQT